MPKVQCHCGRTTDCANCKAAYKGKKDWHDLLDAMRAGKVPHMPYPTLYNLTRNPDKCGGKVRAETSLREFMQAWFEGIARRSE